MDGNEFPYRMVLSPDPETISADQEKPIIGAPIQSLHTLKPTYTPISSRLSTVLLQFSFQPSIFDLCHTQAAETSNLQPFTFGPAHVQSMHTPLSGTAPHQVAASPLTSPSRLRRM